MSASRPAEWFARRLALVVAGIVLVGACAAGTVDDEQGSVATGEPPGVTAPAGSPGPTVDAPGVSPEAEASPTLRLTLPPAELLEPPAFASRVVLPEQGIDLPVISGDLQPPPAYPLCDVAAYVTLFRQPHEPGVTYISAHAQTGMFLPLLDASRRQDGAELIGQQALVYTNDGTRYEYRIERVIRHAEDYSFMSDLALSDRYLVLQTSEGPQGTPQKLQVLAAYVAEEEVDVAEATPPAQPRDCRPAELRSPQP